MDSLDPLAELHAAERLVAAILAENPEFTGQQVLDAIRAQQALIERVLLDRADCRHCGKPISRLGDSRWRHLDPDRSRGCGAASFTEEAGWDNTLARTLSAEPPPGWRRA